MKASLHSGDGDPGLLQNSPVISPLLPHDGGDRKQVAEANRTWAGLDTMASRWYLGVAQRPWSSELDLQAAGAEPLEWPQSPPHTLRNIQAWAQTTWAELFGYTKPMLLRDSNVISMVYGLELRVAFLDRELVEISLRMPKHSQRAERGLL